MADRTENRARRLRELTNPHLDAAAGIELGDRAQRELTSQADWEYVIERFLAEPSRG